MRTTLIPSRPMRAVIATAAAALVLTACGGGDDPTVATGGSSSESSGSDPSASASGIDAAHNEADIAFITDMKPHHDGALEMAELAATRAESPQVKDLAARIVAAQDPEIQTMQAMADAWDVDLDSGASPHGGMDMGGGMDMSGDMEALEPMSGAAFDREFLTRMTVHHEGAVEMSQEQLANGENPQAKELAEAIIAAQNDEIAEMKTLLAEL